MGDSRHEPVLLKEVLQYLAPAPGKIFADLTLGGGGHGRALLELGSRVYGFDRDPVSVAEVAMRLAEYGERFTPIHSDFASFGTMLDQRGVHQVDGIFMDLGLSSDQLDDPARGFSFRWDGPLDLRFDRDRGVPAWRRLEEADSTTLRTWLRELGEVRRPGRLARVLSERASQKALRSTAELKAAVLACLRPGVRPEAELARVFQTLRILVNDELAQLDTALTQVPDRLRPGGRFVAIAYHSLEDRRVKTMLRHESGRDARGSRHLPATPEPAPRMRLLTPRVVRPGSEETRRNPRARSARLRAGERTA